MVFNNAFTSVCNDKNICYSGCNCLFNDILNGRFVYDREHFLWH